jgi:hypothetical protein
MNIKAKSPNSKINWKQIAIVAVILGVAAFQYYRTQQAEKNSGNQDVATLGIPDQLDLDSSLKKQNNSGAKNDPNTADDLFGQNSSRPKGSTQDGNRSGSRAEAATPDKPYLKDGRRGTKVSPAGLVYTGSRSGEHRTEHVLRHAKDQPNRPGNHGVFDADGDDVFRLIDEAYGLIKKNSRQVSKDPPRDGKTAYLINMNRRIGYRGGKSGNRAGKPAAKKMKLILAEDRVITAYPY